MQHKRTTKRQINKPFKNREQFRCLETTLKNQNYIQKDIQSRLTHEMFSVIRCRISCLTVCYLKI
jgi:hypothetical protein